MLWLSCQYVFWCFGFCATHTRAADWQSALLKHPGLHTICYQMILSVLRFTWLLLVLIVLTVFSWSLTDWTLFRLQWSTSFLTTSSGSFQWSDPALSTTNSLTLCSPEPHTPCYPPAPPWATSPLPPAKASQYHHLHNPCEASLNSTPCLVVLFWVLLSQRIVTVVLLFHL